MYEQNENVDKEIENMKKSQKKVFLKNPFL